MKKALFFLAVALLGFSSCTIEGPRGPAGRDGRDGSTITHILDFSISNSGGRYNWQWNPAGEYYFCYIPVSQLTNKIYNDGIVVGYIETQDSNGAYIQQALPRVLSQTDGSNDWIEMIDFDYSTESIVFYYTTSDFLYLDWQPGTRNFRVVFLE